MVRVKARRQRRGSTKARARAWWRQPENWVVIAVGAAGALFVVATLWMQTPPKADIDQAAVGAAEASDPRMREIEASFRCPCGNCGHLELADCTCDVPGGALEMKTAIANLLSQGEEEKDVIAAIADRFGGLKHEGSRGEPSPQGHETGKDVEGVDAAVDLHSSHGNPASPDAVMRVASVFDCPCGNCALTLADCTCDHAKGAVEVKSFIRDQLIAGMSEVDVIESVAQAFDARRTQRSLSATSAVSTIQ